MVQMIFSRHSMNSVYSPTKFFDDLVELVGRWNDREIFIFIHSEHQCCVLFSIKVSDKVEWFCLSRSSD